MQASVKNTFLHWDLPEDLEQRRAIVGAAGRSRSADSGVASKSTPSASEADCVSRLNKIWLDELPVEELPQSATADRHSAGPTIEELRQLQQRIAESAGLPPKETCSLSSKRVCSSSSVSTMAPQEDGDDFVPLARAGGMPKAWSSGSVCSLASEFDDGGLANADFSPIMEEPTDQFAQQRYKGPRVAAARDGTKAEFCHNLVPKTVNLAAEFSKCAPQGPPTTMMIRNIPNRYTQKEFMKELEGLGFGGTWDFLYLPVDKGTLCNVGYAFVNFLEPYWAARCMEVFKGYVFLRYRKARGKIAAVNVAHLQGLEANLRHYENSAVNLAPRIKQQRGPIIMPGGQPSASADGSCF
eukprot:gb/GFBE01074773.1/.p1 GENE.gb/GFBE01074773.1/~~gb/GFBE01074773.1/.p1  ORF type:complete len:354 (+),score=76.06 gb/GFBE01074773.1/:1-1062(+)